MRIEIAYKAQLSDGRADSLVPSLSRMVSPQGLQLRACRIVDVYIVDAVPELTHSMAAALFQDRISQDIRFGSAFATDPGWDGAIEIAYKPGVTDPVAITARKAVELEIGHKLEAAALVQTARLYLFGFSALGDSTRSPDKSLPSSNSIMDALNLIAGELHNPLIQGCLVRAGSQLAQEGFPLHYPAVSLGLAEEVQEFDIANYRDDELLKLSEERLLALSLEEMSAIRDHYRDPEVKKARREAGLSEAATDIELEMLGQTWSEHCKHKIFAAELDYHEPAADGSERRIQIKGLFPEFIKKTTDQLMSRRPDLRSVFHDNSGVVDFDDDYVICFKAETHNSPSALDPYGGAITGIVGVNRDILGTGKGAWPFFNTNVLCFGDPDTADDQVLPSLLHPRSVMDGVHKGIVDGGNQSGIPVAAGAFLFDPSYAGKPLVFCGTGGIMPRIINGEESWIQHIDPGDLAVMVGGRIGKDGIHGATFSSLELDESSPTSAVQIGDPITQRKVIDFLIEARDLGLYKGITDNGAGGLSSSLGEMAEYSGGIRVELDQAPLKYPGLAPWEIWVSESQERMSLAVSPGCIKEFLELAGRRGVEASVLGEFTNSGKIDLRYKNDCVGLLSMDFVHDGLPRMRIPARWRPSIQRRKPEDFAGLPKGAAALRDMLLRLLEEPNIRSKEELVRQYDHEVQAVSVIKPFVGPGADGPSDGAVLRPRPDSFRGVSVTHGIAPRVGDDDSYLMAQLAVDEAYRSHIALGGDPLAASALDNFCWPDPVLSPGTPDGEYKMAQLVRANMGLREACLAYTLPLISGKDSMKNDVRLGGKKFSVRPTLLVSLFGIVPDIRVLVSSDFKEAGHLIYLIGPRENLFGPEAERRAPNQFGRYRLGGSFLEKLCVGAEEASSTYGIDGRPHLGAAPRLVLEETPEFYGLTHQAIRAGLFASIHDLSDGGLAVALAESAFGGRLGARIDYGSDEAEFLFNEEPSRYLVSVEPGRAGELEKLYGSHGVIRLGQTIEDGVIDFLARDGGWSLTLEQVRAAWTKPWGRA